MNMQRLNELLRVNICCVNRRSGYCRQEITDFPVSFKPKDVEKGWYEIWEKNKFFSPINTKKEPFKMILPPPNITGILHLGHALTVTVQDLLARWHRMRGCSVEWVPGLDHAGIATQAVVEKYLYKTKGISRANVEEEEFLSHIWEWKAEKADTIRNQLKSLGATLDWSREYFTMDKNHSAAVSEALIILNERNLLYRDKRLINWSPCMGTALSDIEVENKEIKGKTFLDVPGYNKKVAFGEIVEIAYPLKNSKEELVIATTRPETVFGDVAIAVNPDDERYTKYIGQHVWHPMRETFIPVIADSGVSKTIGTGMIKVTPAHNYYDYQLSKNHSLDIIDVIDDQGNMTDAAKEFKGLPRFIARKKVLTQLADKGLLRKVKDHEMVLPICSRSGDIIEHRLKEQWYVKCEGMAERALQAVKDGSLKLDPVIHEQLWYNWLGNTRDWCISRQLWWGHRIPAYYVMTGENVEWFICKSEEDARLQIQTKFGTDIQIYRDKDVLDTWFSSALLPLTTLGWPSKMNDFKAFVPWSLMETGHDILYFWVARMVMLGLELTDHLPFKKVLLHGVLCDGKGRKMSKTLGNVVLPENIINGITLQDLNTKVKESNKLGILNKTELQHTLAAHKAAFPNGIPECGADALRMTLCSSNVKNRTINFDVVTCQTNKFFCNKIWQASKYVLLIAHNNKYEESKVLSSMDRWILSRLALMVHSVNDAFENYNFYKAVASIREFVYYEFCDFYLEGTKWGFKNGGSNAASGHLHTLIKCIEVSLRILAPITPYFADDLYSRLSKQLPQFKPLTSLLEASYPNPDEYENMRDTSLDQKMNELLTLVGEIRSLMTNVSKKTDPEVDIVIPDTEMYIFYNENVNMIKGGTRIFNMTVYPKADYFVKQNSIESFFNINGIDCSIFLSSKDEASLDKIRSNIRKEKLPLAEKLGC